MMDLEEFGDKRIVIKGKETGNILSIIVEGGNLSVEEKPVKEKTGTVVMPESLIEHPSKLKALWHVLLGNVEAYCHINNCPQSDKEDRCPILQLKSCDICGYTFRHALKLIDILSQRS